MADHSPTGPAETGASMDYPEHEKTYSMFISFAKYATLFCVALVAAMAFFFFSTAGGVVNFLFSAILLLVLFIIGAVLLR